MNKAKIFCKGGYVKNEHALNILEYAGEKISSQQLFLTDGTVIDYKGEDKIVLGDIESDNVEKVILTLKDGKQVPLSWDKYNGEVSKKVTSSQVKNIQGDNICENEARKMQDMDIDEYLKYVANRKGVVKDDGYGLFGLNGNVDVAEARKMIMEDYPKSIKWSYIMSLRPEDAYIEGYDNRKAWQDLVCSVAPQIAKAYNISFENLVINAAYHDDKDHKHIHMIFYSKDYTEGFVRGGNESLIKATRKLKSVFVNNIFKDDVANIKDLINSNRKDLKQSLLVSLSKKDIADEKLISMFQDIAEKLDNHTGRKDYGYLPPELKSDVNNLLSYMIKNTDEISELFENLCNSQKQYIEMYNQDEEKIKNQLNIFKASLLNPKKGQADLQNSIVHFLGKYNDEKTTSLPLENLPATKGKKADDSLPFEPPNASENFEHYSNNENYTQDKNIENIINERKLSEHLDNDFSSFDDLDDTTEKPQATKGKKDNDSLTFEPPNANESFEDYNSNKSYIQTRDNANKNSINGGKSSEYSDNDFSSFDDLDDTPKKSQSTKGKKELSKIIYKDISKSAYKSCCELFNPKIKNTVLQEELLSELKSMSQSKKYSIEYNKSAVKTFQIMMTDKDFYDSFNKSLDKNIERFLKDNKYDKDSQIEVSNYINSLKNGKLTSAHWYSQFFSNKIYDQQYFQLMKSFEEFNVPLRKEMRKNIIDNFENVAPVLKEIKEIKDEIPKFLKDNDVNNYVRNKISSIWSTVTDTPEYQTFKNNNYAILEKYMDENADIEKYKKRFENTLDNVERIMRPHFYMITQSEHIDELQLSEAFKNTDLFSPVKSEIKNCLDDSITDYSYSSQFIKEKLLKDSDSIRDILRCLYSQEDVRPVIDKWAENVIKSSGVQDITKYYEDFQLYLRGETCEFENLFNYNKLTNYLRYYKNSYVEQAYTQIKKTVMSEVPKKQIFKLLHKSIDVCRDDWNNLNIICQNINEAEDEEVIENLKDKQRKLITKIGQQTIYEDEEFLKFIETINKSFKQHSGDNNIALILENRLLSDIYSGDVWTVPNFYISFFAEKFPEICLSESLKNKELFEPVKVTLKKQFDNSNDEMSSYLKQELLKSNSDNIKDIVSYLYSQEEDVKPVIDDWAENIIKSSGVQDADKYSEQFQLFLRGEPCEFEDLFSYNRFTSYIRYFKDNYIEKELFKSTKSVIKDYIDISIINTNNNAFSKLFIKEKLLANGDNYKDIIRGLYSVPQIKDYIDTYLYNAHKCGCFKNNSNLIEDFKKFINNEPCENEDLFNHNKLTNYIRFYKDNYIEKELFKSAKTVIKEYIDSSIINTDNNAFSKLYIKEKFLTKSEATKDIIKGLYSVPQIKDYIDTYLYNAHKCGCFKSNSNVIEDFKKFINNEPCENEDLFNYSKLYGYVNFYKENNIENACKAILKAMDEDIRSEMSAEVSDKLFAMLSNEDTSKLLIELYNYPEPSEDFTEKELEEYISEKQKLISNIFRNHLVFDKDDKGEKVENEKIKNYIEKAKELFNQYAGDSDIAQDIEKLFENKIYNGDFYIQPNSQISFFVENLPKQYIKKFLKQDKGKELLNPIYKTISEEIYGKILSNENNQVKDELKNIAKISKQLEEVETQEEKAKLINLANQSVLSIIKNINLDTTNLKTYLQEEIKQAVPSDIQNDVLEQLDKSFEKDVLNFPYGYMIFAMGEDYDLTTSKAIADIMRSDIKSFQSMIYKDIYEVLGQRPSKRLNNPIFKAMISYNNNIASEAVSKQSKKPEVLKQSDIDISNIFSSLMEKPEYKDLYDKIYKNFSCELRKHCSCDDEQVEKLFQKTILEDDYKGINSSIKFMCENVSDIIKKINKQKAIAVLYIIGNTIARNLYDQNRDIQNHLGKINSLNKGKNRFIEKSKRSTFENTILNNYMI